MQEKFIQMPVDVPEAQPLLDQLFAEYEEIYGDFFARQDAQVIDERKKATYRG